ncbi:MAG TPA: dihydrolipoamide acetyltransferase family protein [Anaerolineaceae bacterium]
MADTVQMPKLGFDMAEGLLVRWVKAEGDAVKKGEVLAEIETDKATVEVESQFSGVVLKHLVEEKTSVPVGDPIALIGQAGENVAVTAGTPPSPAPSETEKAAAAAGAAPSPAPAEAEKSAAPAGAAPSPAPAETENATVVNVESPVQASVSRPVKASPLARRMAGDSGLDLRTLKGSGPGGRIVRKDVERLMKEKKGVPDVVAAAPVTALAAVAPAEKAPKPAVSLPVVMLAGGEVPPDQHLPVDKLRGAIGRRMVESKQQVPHFYVTYEYNVEALLSLRKQVNELLPEDQKISVHDFIVKAVALCLRQFPNLNASFAGSEILRHGHVNVGTAVSIEGGVMTVVCKDADQKPLRLISQEVRGMAGRARAGKIRPEDVEGSTFSISNLGMYDVDNFVAIITPPEAAVLAVGSAKQVPVVGQGGELKAGMRMKATLSADHRVTDGAEAAQFMKALASYIEKPLLLLL